MRRYAFDSFGIEHLRLVDAPVPDPGPGEVRIATRALSLNYRDVLVIGGGYNPRLRLPATPLSDAAGVVSAVGDGVTDVAVGDRVMTHFIADWQSGPYDGRYLATTLGTPGPGVAAEEVCVPAHATVPIPDGLDFAAAATLPIAALTAWSALVTEGDIAAGETVLTLGTGGVSVFALQLGTSLGARVIVTSSSDEKLARCRDLGAAATVNYRTTPDWDAAVLDATGGEGAHVVVENGGVGTLSQSLRAVRAGGVVAMLGALTGLEGRVDIAPILMKRVRVAGILVDSRARFLDLLTHLARHPIEPVISDRFAFDALPAALAHQRAGNHFGKIVIDVA